MCGLESTGVRLRLSAEMSVKEENHELLAEIAEMKSQEEYKISRPQLVYQLLIHTFIRPKDPNDPSSFSSGVLTGDYPLRAFTVTSAFGEKDLYFFVYDTKVVGSRKDGTRLVEPQDMVLMKAQVGLEGCVPDLKQMVRTSEKQFRGFTKFTPNMIHRAAHLMMRFKGCVHLKEPKVREGQDYISELLSLICEPRQAEASRHFVKPVKKMELVRYESTRVHGVTGQIKEPRFLNAGVLGRLVDYCPKVEFFFSPDACGKDVHLICPEPQIVGTVQDARYLSFDLHQTENKERLDSRQTEIQTWLTSVLPHSQRPSQDLSTGVVVTGGQ